MFLPLFSLLSPVQLQRSGAWRASPAALGRKVRACVMTSEEKFAKIISALKRNPKVSVGAAKRGFGSSALCVDGKIFAMLSSKGAFVIKLPKNRVDALVTLGTGARFELGRNRVMKEWLVIDSAAADWLSFAREAMKFVGSSAK